MEVRGFKADGRDVYLRLCQFKFNPYSLSEIPGYDVLLTNGIHHPINNPSGMTRDHMLSVEYGWRHNIDPNIIAHPANCMFLSVQDNSRKNTTCSISLADLLLRIAANKLGEVENASIYLPKSDVTRKKISDANKLLMKITNGLVNTSIRKGTNIPDGYKQGITRGLRK